MLSRIAVLAAALSLALSTSSALAQNVIEGPPRYIDADTLVVAGTKVRLVGVDAIEDDQRCSRDDAVWDCAADSLRALKSKIAGRSLSCEEDGTDRYKRTLATCTAKGDKSSLNEWLVCEGWAVAYRYDPDYLPCEKSAKAGRKGIWSGEFVRPEEWRRQMRGDVTGGAVKQGWLSFAGLVLDIVGFLMIAWEWRRGFHEERRERARSDAARGIGMEWNEEPDVAQQMQYAAAKVTSAELAARRLRFWTGTALVIIGFAGQALGSVPGGVPWLGIVQ